MAPSGGPGIPPIMAGEPAKIYPSTFRVCTTLCSAW